MHDGGARLSSALNGRRELPYARCDAAGARKNADRLQVQCHRYITYYCTRVSRVHVCCTRVRRIALVPDGFGASSFQLQSGNIVLLAVVAVGQSARLGYAWQSFGIMYTTCARVYGRLARANRRERIV